MVLHVLLSSAILKYYPRDVFLAFVIILVYCVGNPPHSTRFSNSSFLMVRPKYYNIRTQPVLDVQFFQCVLISSYRSEVIWVKSTDGLVFGSIKGSLFIYENTKRSMILNFQVFKFAKNELNCDNAILILFIIRLMFLEVFSFLFSSN